MSQDSQLRAPVAEVLAVVQSCVDERGPNSASILSTVDVSIVTITVTPSNGKAAPVQLQMTREDAILLTFGRTSIAIDEPADERLARIRDVLKLVFAGSFTEYGPGHAQSKFTLADGTTLLLGTDKSPLQRRFGAKTRYSAYE